MENSSCPSSNPLILFRPFKDSEVMEAGSILLLFINMICVWLVMRKKLHRRVAKNAEFARVYHAKAWQRKTFKSLRLCGE
ncbi:MAG: hypothetical protein EA362_05610 [Saprospirales bacterium]|nr:MAG: hypothetical protein EA362_05610 [Saprospirales bacterium]